MAVLLNIIFLAVFCTVLYVLLFLFSLAASYLIPVRRKFWWAVAFSVLVFFGGLGVYVWHGTRPSVVFERSFGFPPPPDVTALRSSQWQLGDSGTVYLRFKANPSTVQRIAARGLSPVAATEAGPRPSGTGDAPEWWQPPSQATLEFMGRFNNRNFSSEEEYLRYNPTTGEVYYRFSGVD